MHFGVNVFSKKKGAGNPSAPLDCMIFFYCRTISSTRNCRSHPLNSQVMFLNDSEYDMNIYIYIYIYTYLCLFCQLVVSQQMCFIHILVMQCCFLMFLEMCGNLDGNSYMWHTHLNHLEAMDCMYTVCFPIPPIKLLCTATPNLDLP